MANLDRYIKGEETIVRVSVATSTTVINIGDFVALSSGLAIRMTTATSPHTLYGIAKRAHASGDAFSEITVSIPNGTAVYRIPLDTATTFVVGNYFAKAVGSNFKLTDSDTDFIAIAVNAGTSVSYADVILAIPDANIRDAS